MFKKNKTLIISIIIISIIAIIFLIFLNNKKDKNLKIGKNTTSQEFIDYILNIKSYECNIQIEVQSNKNKSKYILKQSYIKDGEITQEVIEPSNLQGIKISKKDGNLIIENSRFSLKKIIENYKEIAENNIDLECFIKNYKENEKSSYKEEDNVIILETASNGENNYMNYKTLYISKDTGKPIKMEIKDTNKNTIIYIIYNEIKINI